MLNVGVIGVGYLGQHHARIYAELDDVRMVAVADTDKVRAGEIAKKYGCEAFTDYRELLDEVDAVSVVTPTTFHYDIAMDCIRAGKDILIEKPITATTEEADRLITASEAAGTLIQVGHLEQFNPVVPALYPLLNSPGFIEAERLSPFQGRGIDVDITLDLMIHDIDVVLSIMDGNPLSDIKAAGAKVLTDTIDVAKVWLEFADGASALLAASRVASDKSRKLTIYQEDSYLVMDYQRMEITKFFRHGDRIVSHAIQVDRKEPLKEELKDFVKCVGSRNRPAVCAIKGRNALRVALQAGAKIKQGWQK
ncbi:MAG: Gfo/Idh/MocA family oxidoreductase [Nitrospirae bacterium]|nr:Gfo/Idh/MocA family oxidoreductase [Nitrospirota bacterium]